MADSYLKPNTIAKCHQRIDDLLHTNRTQADDIGNLKRHIDQLSLSEKKLAVERDTYRIKWKRMLKMHLGLRAVLSTLAAHPDDFEDYIDETNP